MTCGGFVQQDMLVYLNRHILLIRQHPFVNLALSISDVATKLHEWRAKIATPPGRQCRSGDARKFADSLRVEPLIMPFVFGELGMCHNVNFGGKIGVRKMIHLYSLKLQKTKLCKYFFAEAEVKAKGSI